MVMLSGLHEGEYVIFYKHLSHPTETNDYGIAIVLKIDASTRTIIVSPICIIICMFDQLNVFFIVIVDADYKTYTLSPFDWSHILRRSALY